jgi:hypothetical protein
MVLDQQSISSASVDDARVRKFAETAVRKLGTYLRMYKILKIYSSHLVYTTGMPTKNVMEISSSFYLYNFHR